jgi:hypothetical protein
VAVTHWKGEVVFGFLTDLCSESTDAPSCDLLDDEIPCYDLVDMIPCYDLVDIFQAMISSLPNVLTTAHRYHDFGDSSVSSLQEEQEPIYGKWMGLGMFGDFLLVSAGLIKYTKSWKSLSFQTTTTTKAIPIGVNSSRETTTTLTLDGERFSMLERTYSFCN